MRYWISGYSEVCLAFTGVLLLGACATPAERTSNFAICLANERACAESALSAQERQRIAEVHRQQHFQDCLARQRCNEMSLSKRELLQVREAVARLNTQACLRAEATCDARLLTEAQRTEVQEAMRQRNKESCLAGLIACKEDALSAEERAAVRVAYAERNFSGCMNTVGTLVQCNREDLTSEQLEMVRRRNLAANYFLCATGAFGCIENLLTEEQRIRIRANASGRN